MQIFCGISHAGLPSREVLTFTRGTPVRYLSPIAPTDWVKIGNAFHPKTPLQPGCVRRVASSLPDDRA